MARKKAKKVIKKLFLKTWWKIQMVKFLKRYSNCSRIIKANLIRNKEVTFLRFKLHMIHYKIKLLCQILAKWRKEDSNWIIKDTSCIKPLVPIIEGECITDLQQRNSIPWLLEHRPLEVQMLLWPLMGPIKLLIIQLHFRWIETRKNTKPIVHFLILKMGRD